MSPLTLAGGRGNSRRMRGYGAVGSGCIAAYPAVGAWVAGSRKRYKRLATNRRARYAFSTANSLGGLDMLKVAMAAVLALTSLAAPATAQIGSGASSNGYGYGNAPPGGYPGGGYPGNGGYPGGGGYPQRPQTITCASQDYARQRCPVDTRGGVTILQQQSKSACIQGNTWGYDQGGIWVRNGCVATFVVGRNRPGYGNGGGGYPGPGGGAGYGRVINCSSINYQPARCAVDVYNGARLVQDISGSCNRRNWGWDRGGVWVNNGCRGRFEVF